MIDFQNSFTVTLSRKFTIKPSFQIPQHLNGVATLPCEVLMSDNIACPGVPYMLGHCFLKHKLDRDITYDRQQLLWQKQVTIIGSINLGSHINKYHTGVARFQHTVSHRRSMGRQRFAPMSLFFVAQDAYRRSFSEFFSVANENSFLSMKRIKITSFNNCFEQKSLALRYVSISCPEEVSLNTSNHGRGDKVIYNDLRPCYLMCLNNKFVAGLIGLVSA